MFKHRHILGVKVISSVKLCVACAQDKERQKKMPWVSEAKEIFKCLKFNRHCVKVQTQGWKIVSCQIKNNQGLLGTMESLSLTALAKNTISPPLLIIPLSFIFLSLPWTFLFALFFPLHFQLFFPPYWLRSNPFLYRNYTVRDRGETSTVQKCIP